VEALEEAEDSEDSAEVAEEASAAEVPAEAGKNLSLLTQGGLPVPAA
jgi:hypothetical protein